MKLYFYNQLLYGGRLADLAGLPREEQEQLTQHSHYLQRCLSALQCPLHQEITARVLPEWDKGKISFSLFTCCSGHAFDVQKTMRRHSLKGECLAGTPAAREVDPLPIRPGFALLPVLRSLLGSVSTGRRTDGTSRHGLDKSPVPRRFTA